MSSHKFPNVFHPDFHKGSAIMPQGMRSEIMETPAYMGSPKPPAAPEMCEVAVDTVKAVRGLLESMAETFRMTGMLDLADQAETVADLLS